MDGGYPQSLIENLLSEIKFKKILNNKEEKEILVTICDKIPALSVYYKVSLNEKMESYTKPTITSINF